MWVPFSRPFPGNEAHKLFSGGPKCGGQNVYVEKVYVLFRSPESLPVWNGFWGWAGPGTPAKSPLSLNAKILWGNLHL